MKRPSYILCLCVLLLAIGGSVYALSPITNGEAMSSVRTKLNKLIARFNPTNLSAGTTLTVNTAYYDTLSANRTWSAFSGTPAEGDFIHAKLNVTGATRTLNFHTNNTVYRVGDSGALAAAIDFPVGTHWFTLEYANARWELADSGIDDETTNLVYASPNGSTGTPTFRALVAADLGTGVQTDAWVVAISDETTALTTGTAKVTFRAPYAATVTGVRLSTTTANTGATLLTVDINETAVSILSTKLTTDASEKTSTTAATAAVISDSAIASDAEITIDIDAVGNTIAGAGAKVYIIHTH